MTVDVDEARAALDARARLCAAGDPAAAAAAAGRAAETAALPFLPHHESGWADELSLGARRAARRRARAAGAGARARRATCGRRPPPPTASCAPTRSSRPRTACGSRSSGGPEIRAGALKAYERCRAVLGVRARHRAVRRDRVPALRGALDQRAGGAGARRRFGRLSVLVVEDHDFQRRTALTLLRGLGVGTLSEAEDGDAALDAARRRRRRPT